MILILSFLGFIFLCVLGLMGELTKQAFVLLLVCALFFVLGSAIPHIINMLPVSEALKKKLRKNPLLVMLALIIAAVLLFCIVVLIIVAK